MADEDIEVNPLHDISNMMSVRDEGLQILELSPIVTNCTHIEDVIYSASPLNNNRGLQTPSSRD
jgi:hypothetical protein